MKYIIANWKANKTQKEALAWIKTIKKAKIKTASNLKFIICPSYIHLHLFINHSPNIILGAQTLSPYPDGAYTGAVSARMLADQVKFVILGHSERRRYFKETNTTTAQQARLALGNKITPIIAVDKDNYTSQLHHLTAKKLQRSFVMYEPPEAISIQAGPIGKGKPAPLTEVLTMIQKIRKEFNPKAILYGGSIKSNNIAQFLGHNEIDGVVPGSASLNPDEFIKMVNTASLTLS